MEINKIYNGDCMTLMGDIDDGVIDLVVTDPPYLHDKSPIAPTTDKSIKMKRKAKEYSVTQSHNGQ